MSPDPAHRDRLVAWQEHLRAGGTTAWGSFSTPAQSSGPPVRQSATAVHLEVVRRLDSAIPDFTGLADLVLATPLPGRGSVDVPVAGDPSATSGSPGVDPGLLGVEDLLRLCSAVLVRLVLDAPVPHLVEPRARLLARRFRVWGVPVARQRLRDALLAAGWQETPRGGTTFVLGAPVPESVGQVWAQRVDRGGTVTWPHLWRRLRARDALPGTLDYAHLTDLADRVGGTVVGVFGSFADVAEELRGRHRVDLGSTPDLVAVDLVRRLNAVLGTRVPASDRPALAPVIAEVVGRSAQPITVLPAPAAHRGWARVQGSEQMPHHLGAAAGYAPPRPGTPARVPGDRVLDLALEAIGRGWMRREQED